MSEREIIKQFEYFSEKMSDLRTEMGLAFQGFEMNNSENIYLGEAVFNLRVIETDLEYLVTEISEMFRVSLDCYKTKNRK